jgi:anti-anti-sigma factor
MPEITSEVDPSAADASVLSLRGELDVAVARAVVEQGTAALAASGGTLVVDLIDVTFMDSSALGALVTIRNNAVALGRAVVVRNAQPAARRIFEITGLIDAFGLDD